MKAQNFNRMSQQSIYYIIILRIQQIYKYFIFFIITRPVPDDSSSRILALQTRYIDVSHPVRTTYGRKHYWTVTVGYTFSVDNIDHSEVKSKGKKYDFHFQIGQIL